MIPLSKPRMTKEIYDDVTKVLVSGWWTMGKYTETLEGEFAEYIGTNYAVAVNSCSMALFLCLKYQGLHGFNMVATTPLTFCSTINAIEYAGGMPLLFDVDKTTQCIDLTGLKVGGTRYLWGILPVHFGGYPCRMDTIADLELAGNIKVIHDCAHAVETEWGGKKIGSYGEAACYSFNPTKNIAAPEMGMVTTDNRDLAHWLRRVRIHGMDADASKRANRFGDYFIDYSGWKANPTDIEAVVALHQLRMVEENWGRRLDIATAYCTAFLDFIHEGWFNGNMPNTNYWDSDGKRHGLHLFQIHINNRDKFIVEMRGRGIYCGIHYRPIHLHPYYQRRYGWKLGDYPNAEWIGEHTCSLPLGPGMSEYEVAYVIENMRAILKTGGYLF